MEVCSLCGCFVCSITLSKIWKHDKGSWSVRKNSMQDPLRWKPSQRCQRYYKNHEICVRGYYDILQHMIVYCFLVVLTKVHLLWLFTRLRRNCRRSKKLNPFSKAKQKGRLQRMQKGGIRGTLLPVRRGVHVVPFYEDCNDGGGHSSPVHWSYFLAHSVFWSSSDIMICKWTWMDLMIFPPIMALNQDTQLPWFFLAVFIVGTSTTSGSF